MNDPPLYLSGGTLGQLVRTPDRQLRFARQRPGIGLMLSPDKMRRWLPEDLPWAADNGIYGRWSRGDEDRFDPDGLWNLLYRLQLYLETCCFATVPDMPGDAEHTLRLFEKHAEWVRGFGVPVAFVAQDGQELLPVPWELLDVVFLGGSDEWKLGEHARRLTQDALARGKSVHMGRVNSGRRFALARLWGVASVDGNAFALNPSKIALLDAWRAAEPHPDDL